MDNVENIPGQLIYPDSTGANVTNVLLVSSELSDKQQFIDAVNENTFPIIYSTDSNKTELLTLLQSKFSGIQRIGLAFHGIGEGEKPFLDNKTLFLESETEPYSENVVWLLNLITEFNIKNIDFLGCNTLNHPTWVNYYNLLTEKTGVVVGASDDYTGNLKYGGDWVMESTSEDVELIYFTESIEYYKYLLVLISNETYNISYTLSGTSPNFIATVDGGNQSLDFGNSILVIPATVTSTNVYTVTAIANGAFNNNTKISGINIPSSVTSIHQQAFWSAPTLTTIIVDASNTTYSSDNGVLFNVSKNILYCYPRAKPGPYSIPATVTSLGNYSFFQTDAKADFSLCTSLNYIGQSVFQNATIRSLNWPDSITTIDTRAFESCNILCNLVLPAGLINIGQRVFRSSGVTEVDASRATSLTYFGDQMFLFASNIASIKFPPNITSLASNSVNSTRLSGTFTPPSTITNYNANCLANNNYITTVDFRNVPFQLLSNEYPRMIACRALTTVLLNPNVPKIDYQQFFNCSGLRKFIIQSSITEIGYQAFQNCSSLNNVYFMHPTTLPSPPHATAFENKASVSYARYISGVTDPNQLTSSPYGFTYAVVYPQTSGPIIENVTMNSTSVINISGSYFLDASSILINGTTAATSFIVNLDNSITATLPSTFYDSITSVSVIDDSSRTATISSPSFTSFAVAQPPIITHVLNNNSNLSIDISGTYLTSITGVTVNDISANIASKTDNLITVNLSSYYQVTSVKLYIDGMLALTRNVSPAFYPRAAPTIQTVSMNSNVLKIDISGNNFLDVSSVLINGFPAASIIISSNNLITATLSSYMLITYVNVTNRYSQTSGNFTVNPSFYPNAPTPVINNVTANPTTDLTIDISGTDLLDISYVLINSSTTINKSNLDITNNKIKATLPSFLLISSVKVVNNYDISFNLSVNPNFYPRKQQQISTVTTHPTDDLKIDISGSFLIDTSYVLVNSSVIDKSKLVITSNKITAELPSLQQVSSVSVVNTYDQSFNLLVNPSFYPRKEQQINYVTVHPTENLKFNITGEFLSDTSYVWINNSINNFKTAQLISDNQLTVTLKTFGLVDTVKVFNSYGFSKSFDINPDIYTRQPPTISSVTPSASDLKIDINGEFLIDTSYVLVNNSINNVSSLDISNNKITATLASFFDVSSVSVVNNYDQLANLTVAPRFYPRKQQTISSVTVHPTDNLTIDISGSFLLDASYVLVNGNRIDNSSLTISSNKITARLPSFFDVSSVRIVNTYDQSANLTLTSSFFPRAPPSLSDIKVNPINKIVDLSGNNLLNIVKVEFMNDDGVVDSSYNKSQITTLGNTLINVNLNPLFPRIVKILVTDSYGVTAELINRKIISNTCFVAGTPINCDQGAIDIDKINSEYHTIRGKRIVAVTQSVYPDKNIVCIEKDAFGKNIPSQKTLISKDHKVYYNRQMQKIKTLVGEVDGVKYVKYNQEVLYNVLLEEHDKMVVNNLICETLHPDNGVAKLYTVLPTLTPEEQNELITELNNRLLERKINKTKNAAR